MQVFFLRRPVVCLCTTTTTRHAPAFASSIRAEYGEDLRSWLPNVCSVRTVKLRCITGFMAYNISYKHKRGRAREHAHRRKKSYYHKHTHSHSYAHFALARCLFGFGFNQLFKSPPKSHTCTHTRIKSHVMMVHVCVCLWRRPHAMAQRRRRHAGNRVFQVAVDKSTVISFISHPSQASRHQLSANSGHSVPKSQPLAPP